MSLSYPITYAYIVVLHVVFVAILEALLKVSMFLLKNRENVTIT